MVQLPQLPTAGGWAWLAGLILVASMLLTAALKIHDAVKRIVAPVKQFMDEHDTMWEDYNVRHGGTYRRNTGRGSPTEPNESALADD